VTNNCTWRVLQETILFQCKRFGYTFSTLTSWLRDA